MTDERAKTVYDYRAENKELRKQLSEAVEMAKELNRLKYYITIQSDFYQHWIELQNQNEKFLSQHTKLKDNEKSID